MPIQEEKSNQICSHVFHCSHLLEPDALGRLSTELAEQANAWSLILPRSVISCELLLKCRDCVTSFGGRLKYRLCSLNKPISLETEELRKSFDCNGKHFQMKIPPNIFLLIQIRYKYFLYKKQMYFILSIRTKKIINWRRLLYV